MRQLSTFPAHFCATARKYLKKNPTHTTFQLCGSSDFIYFLGGGVAFLSFLFFCDFGRKQKQEMWKKGKEKRLRMVLLDSLALV